MTSRIPLRIALLAAVLGLPLSLPVAGADFSSLEERMSDAEFKAAGLDKLTPEQLAALNAWLQRRTAGTAPAATYVPPSDDRIGFRDPVSSEGVVSRIAGEFSGWSGDTRFTLENGQVWEQAESGSMRGVSVDSPAITIKPAFMGSWLLKVEGFNKAIRVRRVK
jgi:hypothetical protein